MYHVIIHSFKQEINRRASSNHVGSVNITVNEKSVQEVREIFIKYIKVALLQISTYSVLLNSCYNCLNRFYSVYIFFDQFSFNQLLRNSSSISKMIYIIKVVIKDKVRSFFSTDGNLSCNQLCRKHRNQTKTIKKLLL